MKTSESIKNIAKALFLFQVKAGKINKDAKNPFFKSNYASLPHILEEISTPMQEAGLCFVQFPCQNYGLTTRIIHSETGEYMEETYFMEPVKKDPQAHGSAISYQRRYALCAILGLQVDDDDANEASGRNGKPTKKQNAKKEESLDDAIADANKADTLEKLQTVWNDYSPLHRNQRFKDTVNRIKMKITKTTKQPA